MTDSAKTPTPGERQALARLLHWQGRHAEALRIEIQEQAAERRAAKKNQVAEKSD